MEATTSYRLKSQLSAKAKPRVTRAMIDAAARAVRPYEGGFAGRGITVCAGGYLYFTNAWVLIRMLRKLGCRLPVQFWYYGEEEMDGRMRKLVEPYGVECVDARKVAAERGVKISAGWPLKPFSILHSPFEEVLALDADNFPIRDPEYLFEENAYLETGAIFWPDVGRTPPEKAIWKTMGVPFRNEPEFESGQIVVNKALCWEPLNLAMWMNEEGRAEVFYKLVWGDKDTFRFAWHKFGFPFAMTPVPVQMLSVVGGPCCSGVMCQHDLDGERIFQHRNLLKWQLFGENPWVPGYLFEGECREFLAELRGKWNGRIGAAAGRATGSVAEWTRKLQKTVWLLETSGEAGAGALPPAAMQDAAPTTELDLWPVARQRAMREVEFLVAGHCGRSSVPRVTFWDLHETGAEVRLRLAGREGAAVPTAVLKLQADGSWRGRALDAKEKPVLRLWPLESVYPSAAGGVKVRRGLTKKLHVFNSARGIGDHLTALYACVGAANAGSEVVFHTRYPQWLERASHPGLTITGELPPRRGNGIDLNHDSGSQLRYAKARAQWYADAIQPGLKPARPARVDREIRVPRFDFDRYVLLAPFSAWARRDWPGANWTRLTHLLREAGWEVVATGVGSDAQRFDEVFSQTTALWAIDHPPEWMMDAMLGAACVIGNDSGMAHLAGLLGVPTVSIHAHLPPQVLFSHTAVTSLTPKTNCTFCRWQPERGYNTACDAACSALATVGPEEVLRAVEKAVETGARRENQERPVAQVAGPVSPSSFPVEEVSARAIIVLVEPKVVAAAEATGWTRYYPLLTDAGVAAAEASANPSEQAMLNEFFAVRRVVNPKPSRNVISTSLFWKNVDAGDGELPKPTMKLLREAKQRSLVKRYDPWSHYVQPLLRGAEKLAVERPEVTVRVYLASDLAFLLPMLVQHCEVRLMKHSSLRHNPGAMWRFLALGDADDNVTIVDADGLEAAGRYHLPRTDALPRAGVMSWREPWRENGPWELCGDGRYFKYRPMIACGFGSRVRVDVERLMKAFVWHYQKGSFARTVSTPEGREIPHFQNDWPGYGADEWFLATTLYPRLLPHGFLTLDRHPLHSAASIADAALNEMTHSQSRRC